MNIQDVTIDTKTASRLDLAILTITSLAQHYGTVSIIGCDELSCAHIVPATSDHTFIRQALSRIHTNLLKNKSKDIHITLPTTSSVTLLSDGGDGISLPRKLSSLLSEHNTQLDIIGIGGSSPQVVIDPSGNLVYREDIRQTHARNDQSLQPRTHEYQIVTSNKQLPKNNTISYRTGITSRVLLLALLLISLGL